MQVDSNVKNTEDLLNTQSQSIPQKRHKQDDDYVDESEKSDEGNHQSKNNVNVSKQGLRQDSEAATINELTDQSKRISC